MAMNPLEGVVYIALDQDEAPLLCVMPRTPEAIRADLAEMGAYMNANPPTMTDMMVYSDLVQELADADPEFAAEFWKDAGHE